MDRLGEAHREKFTREDRLLRRREFEAVYARGVRIPGFHFTLIILPNSMARSRLGLTVSRKVGNSVVRNRTRRRLREIFRRCRAIRSAGLDIVVQTRPAIAGVGLSQLETEFKQGMEHFSERRRGKLQ